jgi:hypothetical protein
MARDPATTARTLRDAISASGFDVYEPLKKHPKLVYALDELEARLREDLIGQRFPGPIRTRSKLAKTAVCKALGYPSPKAFRRVQPRFPGQDLDVHVQLSNNVQIWNQRITPTRRHVLIRVDDDAIVRAVRVIEGVELAQFDTTGTPTIKYQAKRRGGRSGSALISVCDTEALSAVLQPVDRLSPKVLKALGPGDAPLPGKVLTIAAMHRRLIGLVGRSFDDPGTERRRGEGLHRLACEALGLGAYADTGRFPDIVCQALEVKLQTAQTVDLGLVNPVSDEPALSLSPELQYRDARYLVAYGTTDGKRVEITDVVVSTGADFYDEFQQFGGLTQNHKFQMHLPVDFFT